jgi:hypothetical protein
MGDRWGPRRPAEAPESSRKKGGERERWPSTRSGRENATRRGAGRGGRAGPSGAGSSSPGRSRA